MTRGWMAAAGLVAACGGGQRGGGGDGDGDGFDCNGRRVGYVAKGTIAAAEIGVAADCAERGPRLIRWRVDADGTRLDDARSLAPGEFDGLWKRVAETGWRDLGDCNATGDNDPVYAFTFGDRDIQNSFECQSADPPFPYHTIIDELDRLGSQGKQLAPDVVAPDELAPKGKR